MFRKNALVLSIIFACQLFGVRCQNDLVFVIDDTGSMMDDIEQVKTQVDELFDAAVKSNASQIVDFLIVTFNDPGVKDRVKTNDRQVFKKALNDITVDGGGDCPEMALTGLELALQKSRNNSLVYLFTDATAKDADKMETVKTLAKDKKCRLFFMLTGNCYGDKDRTFLDLAEATDGQVFSLFKQEVGQMLGHARETIAGGFASRVNLEASSIVSSPRLRAGYGAGLLSMNGPVRGDSLGAGGFAAYEAAADSVYEEIPSQVQTSNFVIDESTKEALVSVSGRRPEVYVTGPDGTNPKTENIANTSGSKVFKIVEAQPGTYTIRVMSDGPSTVVVNTKLMSR